MAVISATTTYPVSTLAANLATVYPTTNSTTPNITQGVSAPVPYRPGTALLAVDGHEYIFAYTSANLASAATVLLGTGFTCTATSTGTFKSNISGGVTGPSFLWVQKVAL